MLVVVLMVLVAAPLPSAAAVDIDYPGLRAVVPEHAGWVLLAGFGLLAVAVAALTLRRHHKSGAADDDAPLGEMRFEALAPPAPASASAIDPPELAEARSPAVDPIAPEVIPSSATFAVESQAADWPAEPPAEPGGSHLFLALQHVDLSIEVLRRHLDREPRPMPAVWLMLLDLCRTHGREQAFAEIALEFHRRFNVCTAAWSAFPPNRDDPGLEAYPRLVKTITQTWGTHEGRRLLDRLLYDNRNGNRRGFTLNAYNDLIALRRAADAVLDSIEKDLAEEAKVRDAFAAANAEVETAAEADGTTRRHSPLVRELESQLDGDLHSGVPPQSALEREHPALVGMLAREWGNAALAARLCEMLARGGDGARPLSKEAARELNVLRRMAERLCKANGISIATGD